MEECINQEMSLVELLSIKAKLIHGIKELTVGQVWDDVKKDHERRIRDIDQKIAELENAAKTGGIIRLM